MGWSTRLSTSNARACLNSLEGHDGPMFYTALLPYSYGREAASYLPEILEDMKKFPGVNRYINIGGMLEWAVKGYPVCVFPKWYDGDYLDARTAHWSVLAPRWAGENVTAESLEVYKKLRSRGVRPYLAMLYSMCWMIPAYRGQGALYITGFSDQSPANSSGDLYYIETALTRVLGLSDLEGFDDEYGDVMEGEVYYWQGPSPECLGIPIDVQRAFRDLGHELLDIRTTVKEFDNTNAIDLTVKLTDMIQRIVAYAVEDFEVVYADTK